MSEVKKTIAVLGGTGKEGAGLPCDGRIAAIR